MSTFLLVDVYGTKTDQNPMSVSKASAAGEPECSMIQA